MATTTSQSILGNHYLPARCSSALADTAVQAVEYADQLSHPHRQILIVVIPRMRCSENVLNCITHLTAAQMKLLAEVFYVKILPRLLLSGSTGNVGMGLRSERSYSHFRRIHTSGVGSLFSRYPSRPAWSLRGSSHMPCVGLLFSRYPSRPPWSLHGSSHMPCVGLLFSRYPSRPAWSLRGFSHTPCVVSLFSRYPSRPAWSLHGSSHTPCVGSLFSRYPSRPAWSLRGFSHTSCVGSLFWGGMVAAPVTGIER